MKPDGAWIRTMALHVRKAAPALAVATAGGTAFFWMGTPLPWLLGALTATILASFSGLKLEIAMPLRTVMVAVLGVMIGSTFKTGFFSGLVQWWPVVIVQLGLVLIMMSSAFVIYRYILKLDRATAYFASAPGGITEMSLIGESFGADAGFISLVHAIRAVIVISFVPVSLRFIAGLDLPSIPRQLIHLSEFGLSEGLFLIAFVIVGIPLGKLCRLPAPALAGPMLLSVAAHMAQLSASSPPIELVASAQVVLGASLGSRFSGTDPAKVWKTLLIGVATAVLTAGLALGCAILAAPLTGRSVAELILSFQPGGVAEMGLVALSLGISTAIITAMHILRITIIILAAPILFRLLGQDEKQS